MRILVVEDDFLSRKAIQMLLSPFGECDIAVDGLEAIEAFKIAHDENTPYDLICLDIMMPEMDGREALKKIRTIEKEKGLSGFNRVKIFMTTALNDPKNIVGSFVDECQAYIIKPVTKEKLTEKMREFDLIK